MATLNHQCLIIVQAIQVSVNFLLRATALPLIEEYIRIFILLHLHLIRVLRLPSEPLLLNFIIFDLPDELVIKLKPLLVVLYKRVIMPRLRIPRVNDRSSQMEVVLS